MQKIFDKTKIIQNRLTKKRFSLLRSSTSIIHITANFALTLRSKTIT